MSPMRCLVVDDEELARSLLEAFIERLPWLEWAGSCKDPVEALQALHQGGADLLFLDIQMPELSGIEFLRSLSSKPLVIFTTAYSEYALDGYELDVVDYLLKPFSFERFVQAVEKARERFQAKNQAEPGYLLIRSEHKIHRVPAGDVLFIQSMREYVAFYTSQGRILSLGSLKNLEETLPAGMFIRVHKSYIVARSKVSALDGNTLAVGKERIPVGANYRETVMRELFF